MNLEMLKHIPAGTEGHLRRTCETCGLYLSSEGGYRIPGLKGLFCSLVCVECGIAERTGKKKRIGGAPIGGGAELLLYLKTAAPGIYAQVARGGEVAASKWCLKCGISLDGKRADSKFCSDVHRKRFTKSSTAQNGRFIAETPIGKQGLSEAQNVE